MSSLIDSIRRPSITNVPPTRSEQRRNDLIMIALILFAILLGWRIGLNARNAVESVSLGGQLPELSYPALWLVDNSDDVFFRALDPRSASAYDARVEVFSRELRENETLDSIGVSWPLRQSERLERFRHLNSQVVGDSALRISYAFLADPTRASGALGIPVVVRADDLLFVANDGSSNRLLVISTAANASHWDAYQNRFERVFASLGVIDE